MKFFFWGISVFAIILLSPTVYAAPAAPIELTLSQPDGATFTAKAMGDEFANWLETSAGQTVVRENGIWYYALKAANGQLAASPNKVGALSAKALSALPLHLSPSVNPRAFEVHTPRSLAASGKKSLTHTQYVLTVLVDYLDIAFVNSDANLQASMFGATDSVKEFFLENTYNGFTVTPAPETYGTANDGIVHVVRPINHPNIGSGDSRSEASAIMSAANASINYASFDSNADGSVTSDELAIVMILAGYEYAYGGGTYTPAVWGHAWSLSSPLSLDGVALQPFTMFGERHRSYADDDHQATIGIMCHELGHLMLLLPDLYDTNGGSEGIGEWGLMGSGSWNYAGSWPGDSPSHLSAWCKTALDIVTPADISTDTAGAAILQGNSNASILRMWIDKYRIGEYFLIENRQLSGYDAGLPGSGLLIWHVDERQSSNADESHKMVDLEEADGLADLDAGFNRGDTGDPYPGSTLKTTFNDAGNPNSKDYANAATGIAVTNVSNSGPSMTVDLTTGAAADKGNHVRYDEYGASAYGWGYGFVAVWTALRVTNNTSMDRLDGFEVFIADTSATIDFELYESIPGGMPTTLLHSQSGFSAVYGWNRFLLDTPQSFPPGSDRVIALRIVGATNGWPACSEYGGANSGRSYINSSTSGAYYQLPEDLNQIALLSSFEPTVDSIVRASATPTNAASVSYTVTFDKSVTGVDSGDFSLTTTGISGASITGISADTGATRTVTVGTGTGSGTLRLDLDDDDSIVDGIGGPLGGVGVANGDYVSGEVYTIDRTPPTAPTVTGTTPTNDTTPTWSWTAGGGGNGTFRHQLDSQVGTWTETTGTSYAPATALTEGAHILYVQERDAVGNWSSSGSFSITVDIAALTIDIDAPSVTLTKSGPVQYTVTYHNAASVTLDETDISLVTTGTASATVAVSGTSSGEPKTRTVTLSAITGDGPLGFSIAAGTATDALNNSAQAAGPSASSTVDNTRPIITLLGSNPFDISQDDPYTDAGATATDNIDGDISGAVVIDSSSVDTSIQGSYTVNFDVTDAAGNTANTVTRTVIVGAPVPLKVWPIAAALMLVALLTIRRSVRAQ
ncbi:MAG: M6 family metalloprotease domain-containing protein [Candidatus Hydrogenedentales bacterium]|jgi:M6 family metalloprotease-like protein